ncbi:putative colanic acid biosynthesis acetyltransferase WcaF [Pedobacter sp. UYP24]
MDKTYINKLAPPILQLRKNFNKQDFEPGASLFKNSCWYLVSSIVFTSRLVPFSNILVILLRIFGAKIGNEVRIKPGIYIKYPWKITIGDFSWLADCYIENLDQVTIGKNVCISQKAMILTGNHDYKSENFDLITRPIILEDGVWIGANTTICPGITAGSHSIILVGSVLTKNTIPYHIYRGNPATQIRTRVMTTSA